MPLSNWNILLAILPSDGFLDRLARSVTASLLVLDMVFSTTRYVSRIGRRADEDLSIHPPLAVNQPCSLSALGRCVLHRLDDVSRSPLSGKQIHHSGIKSVANISAKSGIHP